MKRVLVSGAGGFIGGRLVEFLASSGNEIWALSRRSRPDGQKVRWVVSDLGSGQLPDSLPSDIDAVIHLAQSEHYRDFPKAARDIWDVSATATQRLFDYALSAGASHVIVASTGGLYGASDAPVSEEMPADTSGGDLSFYFAAKRTSELIAQSYADLLRVVTLRFFFVYGAFQRDAMLMPRLVRAVKEGRPLLLQGENGIRINPIHVIDAVAAIDAALGLECSLLVNVAGPEVVTLRRIGEEIGRLAGVPPRFEVDARAKPNHLIADITLMKKKLITPQADIATGLSELVSAAS